MSITIDHPNETLIPDSDVLDITSVVNAATGYRIAGAATSGNYLRGNGTNFVSSPISSSDAVLSITGTANQIIASAATGNVTLSTPQDIGTSSNVTFGSVTAANIYGSASASGDLKLNSTSHATKGLVTLGSSTDTAYDETNTTLRINSSTSTLTNDGSVVVHNILAGSGAAAAAALVRYTSPGGGGALFEMYATRGASPNAHTIVQNGDGIGSFNFGGSDGSTYTRAASFSVNVDATPGSGSVPMGFAMIVGTSNTTKTGYCRFTSRGNLTINTASTAIQPGTGTAGIFLADATAPGTLAANTAGLYANDVAGTTELFGIDEAGNITQLTPHNFTLFTPAPDDPFPWSYYSRNHYLGVEMGVDLGKLIRLVEQLTGQSLVTMRAIPRRGWLDEQRTLFQQYQETVARWTPTDPDPQDHIVKEPPAWLRERLVAMDAYDESALLKLRADAAAFCARAASDRARVRALTTLHASLSTPTPSSKAP